jgi:hypothetical protein
MVETLDTKWFDVQIQFFQYATIPTTELKFELTPEFQFSAHHTWKKFRIKGRKKWTEQQIPPCTHTHITKILEISGKIFGLCTQYIPL